MTQTAAACSKDKNQAYHHYFSTIKVDIFMLHLFFVLVMLSLPTNKIIQHRQSRKNWCVGMAISQYCLCCFSKAKSRHWLLILRQSFLSPQLFQYSIDFITKICEFVNKQNNLIPAVKHEQCVEMAI